MAHQRRVLIYAGLHRGNSFSRRCRKFDVAYGFEANPELYEFCKQRFRGQDNVRIVHAALASTRGTATLNIASNDGRSSSLGVFHPDWNNAVRMERSVEVPAVNLYEFCREESIAHITQYSSDLQGMDLTVLRTMAPMIAQRRIETIQCEVAKDEKRNIYGDLDSNRRSDFDELLRDHYLPTATGWGSLREGVFETVPSGWWEYDCQWGLDTRALRLRLALRRRLGVGPAIAWIRTQRREAKRRRAQRRAA